MIILKNLKLVDFLSHKSTELSFDENIKLSIGGRSGAGKSSIVEGILWNLYGKGRVDNRNIIRKGEKNASVTIELQEDDLCYQIERKTSEKGKQTLNLCILSDKPGVEMVKVEGLKEKQDWIEKNLLKSSYTLFVNSILYLQDNVDTFVKQTASKRKDLLLEIANIDDYEMYYNRSKEALKLFNEEYTRNNTLLEEKKRIIDSNTNSLSVISELEVKEIDIKESIQTLQLQLNSARENGEKQKETQRDIMILENTLSNLKKQKESYTLEIKTKESSITFLKNVDKDAINTGLLKLKETKERLSIAEKKEKDDIEHNDKIRYLVAQKPSEYDYESDVMSLNKQLISIMTSKDNYCEYIKGNCPKLQERSRGQILYLEEQIKDRQEKLINQKEAIEAYVARLNALGLQKVIDNEAQILRDEIKKLEHWEKDHLQNIYTEEKIKELTSQIEELCIKVSDVERNEADREVECSMLKGALTENSQDWIKVEQSINECIIGKQSTLMTVSQELTLAKHAKKIMEEAEKEVAVLLVKISEIIHKIEVLEIIKEAFSSKGIKTLVIDNIVPLLESKINEILGQLSDFRIRLDTQRQSADGETMVEGLYISLINGEGCEYEFDSYSGGEKLRIHVAITEGLASLTKNIGFRIMDEAIQALNPEMMEDFMCVLKNLQSIYPQVFVISHLREVQDSFDSVITVEKHNGISTIKK